LGLSAVPSPLKIRMKSASGSTVAAAAGDVG
jgi:hypothetical protein